MQKQFKKTTLIGLALMLASAITSAIMPIKSNSEDNNNNSYNNGTLRQYSGGDNPLQFRITCVNLYAPIFHCHATIETGTTNGDLASLIRTIEGHTYQTINNTSISNSRDSFDTTSYLEAI